MMKRRIAISIIIASLVMIFVSCKQEEQKPKPTSEPAPQTVLSEEKDENIAERSEVVFEYKGSEVSLDLPQGWKYETEDNELRIWPAEATEGKIIIKHFDEPFGVCGTGLEEKKITLGGQEAIKGIYWDDKLWSFISFPTDETNPYVILNQGAEKWKKAYREQIMEILNTLKF